MRREERKLPLFADNITVHAENSLESSEKLRELIGDLSKTGRCKMNIKPPRVFLQRCKERLETNLRTKPFTAQPLEGSPPNSSRCQPWYQLGSWQRWASPELKTNIHTATRLQCTSARALADFPGDKWPYFQLALGENATDPLPRRIRDQVLLPHQATGCVSEMLPAGTLDRQAEEEVKRREEAFSTQEGGGGDELG